MPAVATSRCPSRSSTRAVQKLICLPGRSFILSRGILCTRRHPCSGSPPRMEAEAERRFNWVGLPSSPLWGGIHALGCPIGVGSTIAVPSARLCRFPALVSQVNRARIRLATAVPIPCNTHTGAHARRRAAIHGMVLLVSAAQPVSQAHLTPTSAAEDPASRLALTALCQFPPLLC